MPTEPEGPSRRSTEKPIVPNKIRDEDVAWREQIRKEDIDWRQQCRKEDIRFRRTSRDADHELRRRESALSTRRAALGAAAQTSPEDAAPDTILEIARRFESWINEAAQG